MQRCILSGAPHNTLWKELNSVDDICLFILGILTACHCLPLVLSLFLCVILWRVSAKVWDNYRCQSNSVISQSTFCMDRIPRWALPNSKLLTTSYLLKNSTMHNICTYSTYHQRIRSNKQKPMLKSHNILLNHQVQLQKQVVQKWALANAVLITEVVSTKKIRVGLLSYPYFFESYL